MDLDTRKQYGIAAVLALLIATTHGYHFGNLLHVPPATWAVFVLAGFYIRHAWIFAALLIEVIVIDYFAVTIGGVSNYCLTPAYGFLLPAYASLWMAGRWYVSRYSFSASTLPALATCLLASLVAAEIFSSGSFYFLSGHFSETTMSGFGSHLVQYFPSSLQSFVFWIGAAIIVHISSALIHTQLRRQA